jgi:predicted ATPase
MNDNGYRFERLHVRGYRRLADVEIETRPLAVLIGANGAGKTSLLETWSLLAASAAGQMAARIADYGGITDIMTRDRSEGIAVELDMSVPRHEPLKYALEIDPKGQSYQIAEEVLQQHQKGPKAPPFKHIDSRGDNIRYFEKETKKLVRPTWEHNPLETSLAQVPKMFNEPEALRQRLASSTYYGPLNVAPRAPVRLPQKMQPAALPGVNGEYLVSCLYSLRETDKDQFEVIEDSLAAAFPDFERLDFPPVAAGMLSMTWKDKDFSRPMYMHQLSEGSLRFLWLTALLRSRALPAVTLVDEPEVSLHPELLSMIAGTLREAARRTQLIVATHSDRLIRFLKPDEVLICEVEEGKAKMTWGDTMDLGKWLQDYSLDEVWRMGRMGGRP